ncbi:aldehyde oxidase and xanthine dehydrogenase, molybdopterin binding [Alkaliphilus metalliredigens QYMF]|uniref:Aldehyde oxidase and xanthine dehydrogenase, molybdopterin binding n=1 Tax=Alkaliphilus metalliredigens (strain QYMF) TaxID=293826 RepID=A6TWS1_ALKMQ|nr:molybdopterin cofactor-binding domain-containing protein [Alkaliphilus metalliredigens]ABR50639.1 aldehyde oxidase and xanthine dehydrogenase, molybdopterin binding [Alkaliphilus metalliredigens QYMF]
MKMRGVGIGSAFYGTGYGNGFPDISRCQVELQKDGKVAVYVGATEVGQGAKTIMSQMAAEVLGLPLEDIIFSCEDTRLTPDAGTAAASRQTYNTGNAIKKACENLRQRLIDVAVAEFKFNSDVGVTMKNGLVYFKTFPSKSITLQEIASKFVEVPLREEGVFTAQTTKMDEETGQGAPYWPYTFNVYGIILEVDTETGIVDILKAVCAQDVGRAINPELIEGQMDGGFAMGLGYALMEDLNLQQGQMKHKRFSNYLIPTALDIPELEKIIIEDPESTAPFGAKGIGEPVMLGVAPAILNAIYDAVGVRITEIPVTPQRLLKALKK